MSPGETSRPCPTCKGTGVLHGRKAYRVYTPAERALARKLYREGKSLRAIAQRLHINHPQKVLSLINARTL